MQSVTADILGCLVDITKHMLDRHYIKVSAFYYRLYSVINRTYTNQDVQFIWKEIYFTQTVE